MRHLVLIGLMGAGKTSVGQRCADALGRDFVDTDDLVVAHAGMSIDELFRAAGESHMRTIERAVVADVCASPVPLVIACGGGTPVDPENRKLLRSTGFVVWLHAPAEVLAVRVGSGEGRPLLRGEPATALQRLAAAREVAYEAAADTTIDASGDVQSVAEAVLDAFSKVAA